METYIHVLGKIPKKLYVDVFSHYLITNRVFLPLKKIYYGQTSSIFSEIA